MDIFSLKDRSHALWKHVLHFLGETILLIRENRLPIGLFILICSALSLIGTSLLTWITTQVLMRISGVTYISPANLAQVLLNPLALLALLVEQIAAALMALFQIGGLLHSYSMSRVGLSTDLSSLFAAGIRTARKALHPKNWFVVPFILVLLPLTKNMALSSTTYKLVVPGFINQTIEYTATYRVLYAFLYAGLLAITLVFIFAINLFVLRDDSFLKSCVESYKLGKGRYVRTIVSIGVLTILVNVLINALASTLTVNAYEAFVFFAGGTGVVTKSATIGTQMYALRQVLQSLFIPAVNNAGLTVLFYTYIDEQEMVGSLSRHTFRRLRLGSGARRAIGACVALFIGVSLVYAAHEYAFLADPVDRPLVCAHRGDNVNAPENTMPAFELAFSENLQWIELDVHQTSDDVIVCSHDSNIERVTGHDLEIRDHTLAELQRYEMGDWMPGVYEHVTIPTLEEVLRAAKKNGVNVQVELKGSPGDVDFEEHVLQVIDECGMHDNVMVICQDAAHMQRVAELDPTITKGYCMVVAQGHVEDISYTDNVTIEETNVTPALVNRLHEKGILVFCWTVDLEDTVQYLVSCDVDVIGTDDPTLISTALEHADYSGGVRRVINIFLNQIANMAR